MEVRKKAFQEYCTQLLKECDYEDISLHVLDIANNSLRQEQTWLRSRWLRIPVIICSNCE